MGVPKAGVELAGRPLVAYAVDTVAAAGLDPVVVAKRGSQLPPLDCPVVTDAEAASHPAAGILAALNAGHGRPAVVIACDMPFVPAPLVGFLAGLEAPAAVPRIGGRLQPLLARYEPSATTVLEAAIGRGDPMHEAVAGLDPLVLETEDVARFGDPERIAFNVNDRHDLAAAERLMTVASR